MPGLEVESGAGSDRLPAQGRPFLDPDQVRGNWLRRVRGNRKSRVVESSEDADGDDLTLHMTGDLGDGELVTEVGQRPGMVDLFEQAQEGPDSWSFDVDDLD